MPYILGESHYDTKNLIISANGILGFNSVLSSLLLAVLLIMDTDINSGDIPFASLSRVSFSLPFGCLHSKPVLPVLLNELFLPVSLVWLDVPAKGVRRFKLETKENGAEGDARADALADARPCCRGINLFFCGRRKREREKWGCVWII